MAHRKYEHLVKPRSVSGMGGPIMEDRETSEDKFAMGPGNADKIVWLNGRDHLEDEVLFFVGTDPSDIDYLGAEISIDMGEEHERYVFDKPTAVICPKGVQHNPVIARYVDRPYSFVLVALSGEHGTTYVD
jgi:hypothetical protein